VKAENVKLFIIAALQLKLELTKLGQVSVAPYAPSWGSALQKEARTAEMRFGPS